jgi:NAD+ kinase
VEPKGTAKNGYSVLDNPSDTSDVGQVDEKHWKVGIVQPSIDSETTGADAMHSRLLTKKQLSDMAWGVRELSRRLGSMRLKFKVKSIFVLAKIQDPDLLLKVRQLTKWLLSRERGSRYTVYVQREIKDNKKFDATGLLEELKKDYAEAGEMSEEANKDITSRLRPWDEHMCRTRPHTFDFVITLGGDGTVLYASWLFQRIVPPVLSFSLGSLGFLTKFDFEDYQKTLNSAFTDGVTVSLRLRFEATIMRSQKKKSNLVTDSASGTNEEDEELLQRKRDLVEELVGEEKDDEHTHRPDGTYEILNEVVVDRGPSPSK